MSTISYLTATQNEPSEAMTLADLRNRILANTEPTKQRRLAMASAIKTVARMLRQPIDTLPACPVRLRPLLARVTPAMGRLSAGSWSNARSLLGAALSQIIPGFVPRRFDLAPTPGWTAWLDSVRPNKDAVCLLGRLARWATSRGIEPEGIDAAIIARYEQDLTEQSLTAEPTTVLRKTIAAWNAAADRQDWPGSRLSHRNRKVRRSLPWNAYPASLLEEIERWMGHLGLDPMADRDFRALRPASIQSRRKYLALYLGALVETGQDPSSMTCLAKVIDPAQARAALRVVYERQGQRKTQHLAGLAGVVLMLAQHWVKLSRDQCDNLRRLARSLRPEQEGLAPRNEKRLAQLLDERRLTEVLRLPDTLSAKVRLMGSPTARLAHTFQTAVAIEIFLMTGLRIANVAELAIGNTLILRSDGGVDILIPRESVKNRTAFAAELPPPSARLVREYIKLYRPLLGDASSPWLFPGKYAGTHKSTSALRDQVTKAMAAVVGVEWNPHLFRHLLAKLQLDANPGADALITRALGHKRAATTRQHYAGFHARAAIRKIDELLLERRRERSGQSCRSQR